MRTLLLSGLAVAALAFAGCSHAPEEAGTPAAAETPSLIQAAVADPARPAADTELDADRKPAAMMEFANVKPGMKVGELIPGGGYMTRVFSKAVGPTGKIYLLNAAPNPERTPGFMKVLEDTSTYPNLTYVVTDFLTFKVPEKLDLVWTSQNYHDMHNPGRNLDINAANRAVYDALKPGGIYIVLDHSAADGVEFDAKLHRIDPAKVKAEVLAAGFEFVGESNVLRNPADPRNVVVFDPSIRHKTDQFIYKFRKPA